MGARGAEMTSGSSHPPHFEGAFRGLVVVGPIGPAITRPECIPQTRSHPTGPTRGTGGESVKKGVWLLPCGLKLWLERPSFRPPTQPLGWSRSDGGHRPVNR